MAKKHRNDAAHGSIFVNDFFFKYQRFWSNCHWIFWKCCLSKNYSWYTWIIERWFLFFCFNEFVNFRLPSSLVIGDLMILRPTGNSLLWKMSYPLFFKKINLFFLLKDTIYFHLHHFLYLPSCLPCYPPSRTRIWWFVIVLWRLERARNDLHNPELITLIISVINSWLWRLFRAHSKRHRTMKNRQIWVLAQLLTCYLPGHLPVYPPSYPPSYPSSYLMLPNLTNQFIKLSDGNLQCKWNSDIFWNDSYYS